MSPSSSSNNNHMLHNNNNSSARSPRLTTIAKTFPNVINNYYLHNYCANAKKALIIYNFEKENIRFLECIEQKLKSLVILNTQQLTTLKEDYTNLHNNLQNNNSHNNTLQNNLQKDEISPFLSLLDKISCEQVGSGLILKNYDIIFTTLYACNLTLKSIIKLEQLIESKKISIVFLRGDKESIPFQLEYYCSIPTFNVENEYICGIRPDSIENINDWYDIGFKFSLLNNFNNLKSLSIKESEIPKEEILIRFKDLEELILITSSGEINIKFLQQFTKLTSLTIKFCKILNHNFLPFFINLKKLIVTYTSNKINLSNLINLETLALCSDDLNDEDFINFEKLKYLKLKNKYNNIKGTCFNYLPNLEYLGIAATELEEENLKYLTNLKILKLFSSDIESSKISGKYFYHLNNLQQLIFTPNKEFKEEYLQYLQNLKSLTIFNYRDRKMEHFRGTYLKYCKNLTELIIPNTNVIDYNLKDLKNLKILNVSECKLLTGEFLLNLINLQDLKIDETNIKEEYLINLINLKKLDILNCPKIIFGNFLLNMNQLNYLVYNFIDFSEPEYFEQEISKLRKIIKEKQLILYLAFKQMVKEDREEDGWIISEEEEEKDEEKRELINIIKELNQKLIEKSQ
ncbi:hypothetical protein ABK040_012510 [Willaertia magna]